MKSLVVFMLMACLVSACGKETHESPTPKIPSLEANDLLSTNLAPNELLAMAVQQEDNEATLAAISREANVDLMLTNGATPLTHAVSNSFTSIVEILLDAGADVRKPDRYGNIPVLLAMELHNHAIAKLLIAQGADPDTMDSDRQTILMMAIKQENLELAIWLIDQGVNLDVVSSSGETAASLAQKQGLNKLVRLIDLRLDLAHGQSSEEVLTKIFAQADAEGLRIVLAKSPSVLRLTFSTSPLYQTIISDVLGTIPEMIQLILDQGLSPNGQPTDPLPPLSEAAQRGLVEAVEILVKRGADIENKDALGWSALLYAVKGNQPATAKKLIELGAKKRYIYHANNRDSYMNVCTMVRGVQAISKEEKERLNDLKKIINCAGTRYLFF